MLNKLCIFPNFKDHIDWNQKDFEKDFNQLIWFSYRKDFKPLLIEKKIYLGQQVQNLTSDCNWGCTIRSAQMLLANTMRKAYPHLSVPEILYL